MLEPDEWMLKMLTSGAHPDCPEEWKGIFWQCDQNWAHEHLMTFQDAEWASDRVCLKDYRYNWTWGNTCLGAFMFHGNIQAQFMQRLEISPSGRWISMDHYPADGRTKWMYKPKPGEVFKKPDGEEFKAEPDEFIRVTYNEPNEPKSGMQYQYRMRRIAYLDSNGKVVRTPAYDDLAERIRMPQLHAKPCCCGYFVCASQEEKALKNHPELPAITVVKWAPERK